MSKKALTTFGVTALKKEAGDKYLDRASQVLKIASKLHLISIPGPLVDIIDIILKDLKLSRDYWSAYLGKKLSLKIGQFVAIDEYANSQKVKRLLAAQVVLLSPELELADSTLSYDTIRHNYTWKGRLIELQDSFKASMEPSFCVIHPDENFQPISILGQVHVVRSCTEKEPDFANAQSRIAMSQKERLAIIESRRRALTKV